MSYSIEAIKKKLLAQQNKTQGMKPKTKITFYKPELGEHDIRFLPYEDKDRQPVQEVVYYTNLLDDQRFVSGHQFGMEDPIQTLRQQLFQSDDSEKKKLLTYLKEKSRIYAVIMDRAAEDKLGQVWEISPNLRDSLYGILAHKDYANEAMFDPDTGYDFTLVVAPEIGPDGKQKFFKGKAVKKFTLTPRRKPSKLAADAKIQKKILESIPNLEAYFKAQVKSPEEMRDVLQTRIMELEESSSSVAEPKDQETGSDETEVSQTMFDSAFKGV